MQNYMIYKTWRTCLAVECNEYTWLCLSIDRKRCNGYYNKLLQQNKIASTEISKLGWSRLDDYLCGEK